MEICDCLSAAAAILTKNKFIQSKGKKSDAHKILIERNCMHTIYGNLTNFDSLELIRNLFNLSVFQ